MIAVPIVSTLKGDGHWLRASQSISAYASATAAYGTGLSGCDFGVSTDSPAEISGTRAWYCRNAHTIGMYDARYSQSIRCPGS